MPCTRRCRRCSPNSKFTGLVCPSFAPTRRRSKTCSWPSPGDTCVKPEPRRRGFTDRPLVQLTLVRFREFWREPEAIFWVTVFPILLAAGLGLAFRSRPPDATPIGVVASAPGADRVVAALRREPTLRVEL